MKLHTAMILALVSVIATYSVANAVDTTLSHLPNTRQAARNGAVKKQRHQHRLLQKGSSKSGKGSNKNGKNGGNGNNGNGTNSDNDDEMRGAMVSCTGPGCITDAFLFSSTNSGSTTARTTCDSEDCEAGAAAQASAVNISPDLGNINNGNNNNNNNTTVIDNDGDNNNNGNNTNTDVSDLISETFCAGNDCESEAITTRDATFVFFDCTGFDCFRFGNMLGDVPSNGGSMTPGQSPTPMMMTPTMMPTEDIGEGDGIRRLSVDKTRKQVRGRAGR